MAPSQQLLIAEDNFLIALMIEGVLSDAGFRVAACVDSVTAALDAVERREVTLALVDIDLQMPAAGIRLAAALKADYGIPSLFITGQEMLAGEHRGSAIGVLPKPFDPDRLVDAVTEALDSLGSGRPRREIRGCHWF